jgi:hypothetical protein
VGESKLSVTKDGLRFLSTILWTVLAYNPCASWPVGLAGIGVALLVGVARGPAPAGRPNWHVGHVAVLPPWSAAYYVSVFATAPRSTTSSRYSTSGHPPGVPQAALRASYRGRFQPAAAEHPGGPGRGRRKPGVVAPGMAGRASSATCRRVAWPSSSVAVGHVVADHVSPVTRSARTRDVRAPGALIQCLGPHWSSFDSLRRWPERARRPPCPHGVGRFLRAGRP